MKPSKSLLIAIAAFAVTATGVQAFQGTQFLQKAGLTEKQISAFETAHELREAGDYEAARNILVEAGVDEKILWSVKHAAHEQRQAILKAIEDEDYEAFKAAVLGGQLAEIIDSEEDFEKFVEAHTLKEEGKWVEAKTILDDLGVQPHNRMPGIGHGSGHGKFGGKSSFLYELNDEQREALIVARQANDKEAVRAILEEAGIEQPRRGHHY